MLHTDSHSPCAYMCVYAIQRLRVGWTFRLLSECEWGTPVSLSVCVCVAELRCAVVSSISFLRIFVIPLQNKQKQTLTACCFRGLNTLCSRSSTHKSLKSLKIFLYFLKYSQKRWQWKETHGLLYQCFLSGKVAHIFDSPHFTQCNQHIMQEWIVLSCIWGQITYLSLSVSIRQTSTKHVCPSLQPSVTVLCKTERRGGQTEKETDWGMKGTKEHKEKFSCLYENEFNPPPPRWWQKQTKISQKKHIVSELVRNMWRFKG